MLFDHLPLQFFGISLNFFSSSFDNFFSFFRLQTTRSILIIHTFGLFTLVQCSFDKHGIQLYTSDEKQCQTKLLGGDVDKMVQNFTNFSHILKVITCNQYNEEDFQDDKKVQFCTRPPNFHLLNTVCNSFKPFVVNSERKKLTAFNEFIMVLMRLRM